MIAAGLTGELSVPARARELAARLSALFERDVEIVGRLNDAQSRLRDANERLWSGLAPDAFGLVYDGAAPAGQSQIAKLMSDARSAGGPDSDTAVLGALQQIHCGDPSFLLRVPVGVRGAPPARGRRRRALPAADRGAVRRRLQCG